MTPTTHRLLVVDDNPQNRDILARRLERRGYQVAMAASGSEALEYLSAHPVSTVLLDVQMPGMSGLEVLEAIRQTWSPASLPVLMVTGLDASGDVVHALDLGANDYIAKPVDFPVALARIRTQLLRKEAEDRLRASEERYALAAKGANDGLWDWDLTSDTLHYSMRWSAIIGCAEKEVGSSPDEWFGRVHPDDLGRVRADIDAHLAGQTPHFESEHRMRHKSGAFRWVLTRGLAVRDNHGRALRMAGSQSDITEGKVVDALTGLPNRMLFLDRLERALQRHRTQSGPQFAVLFLDLDGFKLINDSLGHAQGDELLQAVARRLERSLRTTDILARPTRDRSGVNSAHTLARLGGDEFIILLHDIRDVVDATVIADRIHRELADPFEIDGRQVFSAASIGIAVGTAQYAASEEVLRDADTAMYRAKAQGKGRTEVFDVAMREQVLERLHLDTALRHALERQEFVPYYQPIINLRTGRIAAFEALLRWRHPERGIVGPSEFISVIEENGLVRPIGRLFFGEVCRQLRAWQQAMPDLPRVSMNVNFAAQQFIGEGLLDYLLEGINSTGLDPNQLVVEITESAAIGNFANAVDLLDQIRDAGLRIVLDDFGTGYSSLSCLHALPITGVKLDQSFIANERQHPAILRAIVVLAQQLGLTVTAEGVETAGQCEHLREMGCDFAQGYLFAKPMAAEQARAFLEEHSRLVSASEDRVA